MATSLEIAQQAVLRPVVDVAADLGLRPGELEPWGRHAAKVDPSALQRLGDAPEGRLVVVTAITPTASGEGKTTTAIGVVDALRRLGTRAVLTVRQPSLGPLFGKKGGGNGGGRAQVVPMETFDLHLTGDFHAVAAAHNLAAAMLDNHLNHGNRLGIEPGSVVWPRVVDANDRALRSTVIGLGGRANGPVRAAEWIITAASEVMALLSLSDDLADLRRRLGKIVVARDRQGSPVSLESLKAPGAMAALLVDAVKPNLMQTLEGSPVLVHTGPFGNIAQGTSSVVADRLGLRCAEIVVTEAGFGADLGAEKLFDLKCRQSGLRPAAAVLVATVRALRQHGGAGRGLSGKARDDAIGVPDVDAVRRGAENLRLQVGNVLAFGVPVVVAVNAHPGDRPEEQALAREAALAAGARDAVVARHFEEGGDGALDLARSVRAAASEAADGFRLLYPDQLPLREKIETVARRIYRADGVDFSRLASEQLDELNALGHGGLPVCMAKTPFSFSHDPLLGPNPVGYRLPVREVRLYAGAGYVTGLTGEVVLMPGLPERPAAEEIDVGADGRIVGLR
jgi:formate--tetrahydrofolate ligase